MDQIVPLYQRLMAAGDGDAFDRHVFACILVRGAAEAPTPLTEAIGLDRAEVHRLLDRHFPAASWLAKELPAGATTGEDAIEEPDLRRLLCDNATHPGCDEAGWLAAMVARRSLKPNHLWQDLGLATRADLSGLLNRHFAPLAAKNLRDMKWKKFFYRQMCEAEGMSICKSPVCDICPDFTLCYGPEI